MKYSTNIIITGDAKTNIKQNTVCLYSVQAIT